MIETLFVTMFHPAEKEKPLTRKPVLCVIELTETDKWFAVGVYDHKLDEWLTDEPCACSVGPVVAWAYVDVESILDSMYSTEGGEKEDVTARISDN